MRLSHTRLASADEVSNLRAGWSWAMDSFKAYVETGQGIGHDEWVAVRGR